MMRPVTASSWLGRSLVRGRDPFLFGRIRTSDSSQESVLRATAGPRSAGGCAAALRKQVGPRLREVRLLLARGAVVLHPHATDCQAEDGPGGGHPVVRVTAHNAAGEICGTDDEAVVGLFGVPA